MTITFSKTIDMQTIKDIVTTALEGGSNYWCDIRSSGIKKIRAVVPKDRETYLSDAMVRAVFEEGIVVNIYDVEDEEDDTPIGTFDASKVAERLQKMVDDGNGDHLMAELNQSGDAESSDAVFQYMVLGEIIYG
jgi:hypothetical protein